jgi:DNA polymerase III alpha subunit
VKIDNYGRVIITNQEAFDAVYNGTLTDLENVFIDGDTNEYNRSREINADRIPELNSYKPFTDINVEQFDKLNQANWFMPKDYCPDLIQRLYNLCDTKEQRARVDKELELFIQHDMLDLLHYLKYLVDTLRDHKILWGVGRGSSVASYVLFLIGVHKIDSIKYGLDIHEFLKEN